MQDDDKKDLPARLVPPLPGAGGTSHWRVEPLGIAMVEELASRGCSVVTIAAALGMSRDTLRACRVRQPDVDEAYQRGLAREQDHLVGNLRRLADDGNVVANIFLLKGKHGWREGDAPEVNLNVNTGGVLLMPAKQSVEEFLADNPATIIDVTPASVRGD
jgi:hypothetical protein